MGKLKREKIFKGLLSGTVSSEIIGAHGIHFLVKLDGKIEGFPEVIHVWGGGNCFLSRGDKIFFFGYLIKESMDDKESYDFLCSRGIYNETLKCWSLTVFR